MSDSLAVARVSKSPCRVGLSKALTLVVFLFCFQSPSGPAQWVVLADYEGTETGMLSVTEGELVELLDTSSNAWGLVKPTTRPSIDGWVPMAYITPYRADGFTNSTHHAPSLRYHSVSSSEESDTPTDVFEHATVMSPEVLEAYDSAEQRAAAEEKRK